jgi:Ca-activated chloride channel family protein
MHRGRPAKLLELFVIVAVVLGIRQLSSADALSKLEGRIASGGVPARVTVTCGATTQTVTTDASGAFTLTGLPAGTCTLTVVAPGYQPLVTKVTVSASRSASVNLKLQVSPAEKAPEERKVKPGSDVLKGTGTATGYGAAPQAVAPHPMKAEPRAYTSARSRPAPGALVLHDTVPHDTEAYDRIDDNPFHRVATRPLSTFSVDVDTASYSNLRRFLREGRLPPKDAIRIEEMINYFSYDYPAPVRGEPFSITTEVTQSPSNPKFQLVRIGLAAPKIEDAQVPPRNLVFLLDVSGSMNSPNKLPLLKQAMNLLVDQLRPQDTIAIVTYAGYAGLALPATSGKDKDTIRNAIFRLEPGGSTNGAAGIQLAYAIAEENKKKGGINRVILATDGDFNVGTTSQGDLTRLIEKERSRGVFLTVLGFGMGNYKDSTMEKLADRGNGNYAYIDSIAEARKVLVEEAGATLVTVAKDVKLQIEFNPATVAGYRLIGYENRLLRDQDFNDDTKDAGDIGAGHRVTALYEIVPAGLEVPSAKVDALKYQTPATPAGASSHELMTVKIRYKAPDSSTSKLLSRAVQAGAVEFAKASSDTRWAAAIASFGMLLRESPHRGNLSWAQVQGMAKAALGADPEGYRRQALELMRVASTKQR